MSSKTVVVKQQVLEGTRRFEPETWAEKQNENQRYIINPGKPSEVLEQLFIMFRFLLRKMSCGTDYHKIKEKIALLHPKDIDQFSSLEIYLVFGYLTFCGLAPPDEMKIFFSAPSAIDARKILQKSWYNSMKKFFDAVNGALEYIFDEEEYASLLETELAQKYIFCEPSKFKGTILFDHLEFTDGFIAEGKTQFWTKKNVEVDGEFDSLFRLKLKDGTDMPQKYIGIFSLYGICAALFNHKDVKKPICLNRGFGSLAIFAAFSGFDLNQEIKLWKNFYFNLTLWFSNNPIIKITFLQWTKETSPIPWKHTREMEKKLYNTEEKYWFVSSLFYTLLDCIYAPYESTFDLKHVPQRLMSPLVLRHLKSLKDEELVQAEQVVRLSGIIEKFNQKSEEGAKESAKTRLKISLGRILGLEYSDIECFHPKSPKNSAEHFDFLKIIKLLD